MRRNQYFADMPKEFWAHVRSISQKGGYVVKDKKASNRGQIRVFTLDEICAVLESLGLLSDHIRENGKATEFGAKLVVYFEYRAQLLNTIVEPMLMNAAEAAQAFEELRAKLGHLEAIPLNKQSGDKKTTAYLTGIVNMLVKYHLGDRPVNLNPLVLTTVTHEGRPARTLSRRVDGCFPTAVNPIAIWEIKEYYYTTTFGSRVADGVYETTLDGMELEEARKELGKTVDHLLVVDAHYTWWVKGRSYLCRIIDMLHMGYVSEVLFGRETLDRLPQLVSEWATEYDALDKP